MSTPAWVESRILLLERQQKELSRRAQELDARSKQALQQVRAQDQQVPDSGDGGGAIFVVFVPGAYGATPGTPPAPDSFDATVYRVQGTAAPTSVGTKTCLVAVPGPTAANKWAYCVPDGQGHYVVISQSCG